MPTVEFNTNELTELTGVSDLNFLRERIPMLGVDMECLDKDKAVMEIFPNRPDMLCVEGFARALRNFLGIKKDVAQYEVRDEMKECKIFVDKSIKEIRPFISSAIVKNLNITDARLKSLMNIQEKLHITHGRNRKKVAIGIHNLDVINFPVTYKAVQPTDYKLIPLNFADDMYLDEILRKHPKGIEYGKIIKNFDKFPLIVDANNDAVSMPPIINADRTKVTTGTKNLFVEITGTNQYAVEKALAIVACTLADMEGEIYNVHINPKH
ncbi:MAG: phenylalanine--tRNA ligase subunit beta [Candidatus Altiarchaeales archaeon A3]|nr:MAG: phenylalanine--tRNA ligase subunit beta [Candidatus Altiarchaeales archaeon A3]